MASVKYPDLPEGWYWQGKQARRLDVRVYVDKYGHLRVEGRVGCSAPVEVVRAVIEFHDANTPKRERTSNRKFGVESHVRERSLPFFLRLFA